MDSILSLEKCESFVGILGPADENQKEFEKIEEVCLRPQFLFVKDPIIHMLRFYQKKKNDTNDVDDN